MEKNKEYYKNYKQKYDKEYLEKNKDKITKRILSWQLKNKEKVYGYKKTWRDTHPVAQRNQCIKRRARLSILGTFTDAEWIEIKKAYNNICAICKRPEPEVKLTIDHIIPISKGGPNTKENIQPLCKSCNSSKGAKIL